MSADLWAAFGDSQDPASNPWSQSSPRDDRAHILSQPALQQNHNLVDLDTGITPQDSKLTEQSSWISSCVPQGSHSSPTSLLEIKPEGLQQPSPVIQSPWEQEALSSPIHKATTRGHKIDDIVYRPNYEDESWGDFTKPTSIDPWASIGNGAPSEVFWDAEEATADDDDDDEFGDFEKPTNSLSTGPAEVNNQEQSLAMTAHEPQTVTRKQPDAPKRLAPDNDNRIGSVGNKNTRGKPNQPIIDSRKLESFLDDPIPTEDDEWDDWSPKTATSTQHTHKQIHQSVPVAVSRSQQPAQQVPRSSPRPSGAPLSAPPPTNIPPPSILISLLTQLITTLPMQISTALSAFSSSTNSSTSSEKALTTAVRKCLSALRTAARIIAGRKHRWKRDVLLAQKMRIGPSAVGGKVSGMKLSGVDKNETMREDREAIEFIRVWIGKVGAVRKALAGVNAKIAEGGAVVEKLEIPSIAENMTVRMVADAMKSTKGCALCGLKREERIDKVDSVDLFDGFDEWWIEYWGHTECRAFWYQHEKYLQQR